MHLNQDPFDHAEIVLYIAGRFACWSPPPFVPLLSSVELYNLTSLSRRLFSVLSCLVLPDFRFYSWNTSRIDVYIFTFLIMSHLT